MWIKEEDGYKNERILVTGTTLSPNLKFIKIDFTIF